MAYLFAQCFQSLKLLAQSCIAYIQFHYFLKPLYFILFLIYRKRRATSCQAERHHFQYLFTFVNLQKVTRRKKRTQNQRYLRNDQENQPHILISSYRQIPTRRNQSHGKNLLSPRISMCQNVRKCSTIIASSKDHSTFQAILETLSFKMNNKQYRNTN